ncbi:hypothetical protein BDF20DRAFT_850646 [Mycotypha africana]|uniref:uncharacterized protein n=1 Tax=Mycotypha africana TaxID=64632 RepID=UPI0023009718|nr:uncharacterized protein BDF20DRAFT_850646 [Mycotypha africana]KAI8987509.1 hypothetical protein BDF20DRAFT_850646 [Mycotypha africana]
MQIVYSYSILLTVVLTESTPRHQLLVIKVAISSRCPYLIIEPIRIMAPKFSLIVLGQLRNKDNSSSFFCIITYSKKIKNKLLFDTKFKPSV